jgi:hypothetical protein
MRIQEKIEEIRNQPQHVRWRYTFASVFVCMFFVVGIWFMSLGQMFSKTSTEGMNESLDKAQKTLIDGKSQYETLQESLNRVPEAMRKAASEENNADGGRGVFPVETEKETQPLPEAIPNVKTGTGAMEDPSLVKP